MIKKINAVESPKSNENKELIKQRLRNVYQILKSDVARKMGIELINQVKELHPHHYEARNSVGAIAWFTFDDAGNMKVAVFGPVESPEENLKAANARLLDAAKFMRDMIRENDMAPSNSDDSWDRWNESLAVIAKAEGK